MELMMKPLLVLTLSSLVTPSSFLLSATIVSTTLQRRRMLIYLWVNNCINSLTELLPLALLSVNRVMIQNLVDSVKLLIISVSTRSQCVIGSCSQHVYRPSSVLMRWSRSRTLYESMQRRTMLRLFITTVFASLSV
jgi:hypothetical protein